METSEFEDAVNLHYEPAYRFARSLVRSEDDAGELTQEAFSRLFEKGNAIRDQSKIKSWLFTTLFRVFLAWKRRRARWPEVQINEAEESLPSIDPRQIEGCEAVDVLAALQSIDERYRVPLSLFYFENLTYDEIAEMLEIPRGTVMSRISRGKDAMRKLLGAPKIAQGPAIVRFPTPPSSSQAAHE